MNLLKLTIRELTCMLLQYNGNITQNSLMHAILSDAKADAIAKVLRNAGYKFTYPTKTTKIRANGVQKSCDIYLYLEFETNDPDLIQILTELDFKKTATGFRTKLL